MESTSHPRLVKSAFFRKVGDVVYVRNAATGEEFLFNRESGPIFSALRNGTGARAGVICDQDDFISQLHELGLVVINGKTVETQVCERDIPSDCSIANGNLALQVQEECRRSQRLWSAGLELTYRCNEHCRHCYLDIRGEQKASGELTGGEWLNVVDQLSRMGCMNVLVTGGEPTLHSAFLSICERIVRRGMLCDVYTNGFAIRDELFAALCDLPLNSISVSLYAGTANFHDEITGVSGSFRKTLKNLLRFKEAGFNTYAKVPIFRGHLKDYFTAKKLGRKYGFRVLASTILVPGHSGKTRNQMMMDAGEYLRFLKHEAEPDTGAEDACTIEKCKSEPLCQAGQSTLCVSPFGYVTPCNSFPAICGNIRKASIAQIWKASKVLRRLRGIRRSEIMDKCATCEDISYCTVCPGASWSETKGKILPCSWSCEQAHARAAYNRKTNRERKR